MEGSNHTTQNKELRTENQSSHLPFCSTSISSREKQENGKSVRGEKRLGRAQKNVNIYIYRPMSLSQRELPTGKSHTVNADKVFREN